MSRYGQVIIAQGWIGNLRSKLWYATPYRADIVVEFAISFRRRALPVVFLGHALFVEFEDSFHAHIKSLFSFISEREVFLLVESAAIGSNIAFFNWIRAGTRTGTGTEAGTLLVGN